ncbi:MAG: hypothetical protein GEU78_19060 [Actinobacteria bacterium]|nr:hypothetical protein [Actinomycetota bacterium]
MAAKQRRIGRAEQAASAVRVYTLIVPGLLQTAEYTHRLFDMQASLQPDLFPDLAAGRAAFAERQQMLFRSAGRFEFVVPESALLWRPGPDGDPRTLVTQLRHIANLSTLDTVRFGVIPLDAPARVCVMHEFVMIGELGVDDNVEVTIHTTTRELHIRDDAQIKTYTALWERVCDDAVFDDGARDLLATTANRLLAS